MSIDPVSNCPLDHIRQLSNSLPECSWERAHEQVLGRGVKATVYQVCCRRRGQRFCNYVAKVIQNQAGMPHDEFEATVENEVRFHQAFEHLGIAVPLVKAYLCPTHGAYLLMEKRDATIEQYTIKGIQARASPTVMKRNLDLVEQRVNEYIQLAHQSLIAHDDLHANNIMVNYNPQTWEITKVDLIDFGMSTAVESYQQAEKLENATEIRLTINRLRNAVDHPDQPLNPVKPKGLTTVKKAKRMIQRDIATTPPRPSRGMFDSVSPVRKSNLFDDMSPMSPMASTPKTPKRGSPSKSVGRRIMFDD